MFDFSNIRLLKKMLDPLTGDGTNKTVHTFGKDKDAISGKGRLSSMVT